MPKLAFIHLSCFYLGKWHQVLLSKPIIAFRKVYKNTHKMDIFSKRAHKKCFIETVVPLLRLFLMLSMMLLEMCVATENDFIALLRNEAWNKFVMLIVAGP